MTAVVIWAVIWNVRERKRQLQLASTRPPINSSEFVSRLARSDVPEWAAQFVWDEFQPYYFAPLTPYPEDRPISEFRIDGDDLSDLVTAFEKQFNRKWIGQWVGGKDPTLAEFAKSLIDSTRGE